MSITFKSAPDTTFNHDELEIYRTSLRMTKIWKRLHECQWSTAVVVRPRSELADATLWLTRLLRGRSLLKGQLDCKQKRKFWPGTNNQQKPWNIRRCPQKLNRLRQWPTDSEFLPTVISTNTFRCFSVHCSRRKRQHKLNCLFRTHFVFVDIVYL